MVVQCMWMMIPSLVHVLVTQKRNTFFQVLYEKFEFLPSNSCVYHVTVQNLGFRFHSHHMMEWPRSQALLPAFQCCMHVEMTGEPGDEATMEDC